MRFPTSIRTVTILLIASLAFLTSACVTTGQPSPKLKMASKWYLEHYKHQRYKAAFFFAEETARLHEKEFGPDNPGTAASYVYLAQLHVILKKPAEAKPLYQRWLPVLEKDVLGKERPPLGRLLELGQMLQDYSRLLFSPGPGPHEEWNKAVARFNVAAEKLKKEYPDVAPRWAPRIGPKS